MTVSRVLSDIAESGSLSASETVATETPACLATSFMVDLKAFASPFIGGYLFDYRRVFQYNRSGFIRKAGHCGLTERY
jgi:hypothetical protein